MVIDRRRVRRVIGASALSTGSRTILDVGGRKDRFKGADTVTDGIFGAIEKVGSICTEEHAA